MTADLQAARAEFHRGRAWFASSPLYGSLSDAVAADDELLALAVQARAGQRLGNVLFAATHAVVLEHPDDPFAAWFPSVVGDAARDPATAGPAFAAFCARHRRALEHLVRTRLVQTNVAARAGALRHAILTAARHLGGGPFALLEVGASAGVQLCLDRFRMRIGDGPWAGPPAAPVVVEVVWEGDGPPPALDPLPPIAARAGLDLDPVDVTDPAQRRWLRALVWPENGAQAERLEAALRVVAADRPRLVRGDAADGIEEVAATLAPGLPLVVFHAATRIHVPPERQAAFDAALLAPAALRPLARVTLEATDGGRPRAMLLELTDGRSGARRPLALADGHGAWMAPAA